MTKNGIFFLHLTLAFNSDLFGEFVPCVSDVTDTGTERKREKLMTCLLARSADVMGDYLGLAF